MSSERLHIQIRYRFQTKFGPDCGTIKIWYGPNWFCKRGIKLSTCFNKILCPFRGAVKITLIFQLQNASRLIKCIGHAFTKDSLSKEQASVKVEKCKINKITINQNSLILQKQIPVKTILILFTLSLLDRITFEFLRFVGCSNLYTSLSLIKKS